jgi:phosphoribosylaminoimidazolecarboxamide formyltransferase/IMP cyclohydrolase
MKIERAIISVSNKSGLQAFATFLETYRVEILSTGGTRRVLEEMGIETKEISSYTGFPEIMDGRVKTLHPLVHGGILALRDKPDHRDAMGRLGILPIDMVVVNLYPFRDAVSRGCSFEEAIENIDIGGPAMIRAAAKNFKYVTVICDPEDYGMVMEDMRRLDGGTSEGLRLQLARKVFELTSAYDRAIFEYLSKG